MQPVSHVLQYYETKLAWADAADWPHVHLRERVQHYRTINGLWSWKPTQKSAIRNEDAYNKLLEAGVITDQIPFDPPYRHLNWLEQMLYEDELTNPEPTPLQHYIDRTEKH